MNQSALLLITVAITTWIAMATAYRPQSQPQNLAETKIDSQFALDDDYASAINKPIVAANPEISFYTWLKYLANQHKVQPYQKRYSNFGMPYFKTGGQTGKRNPNGIWIWMPAHGYVSVPHENQALVADGGADKSGNVMRYGRK